MSSCVTRPFTGAATVEPLDRLFAETFLVEWQPLRNGFMDGAGDTHAPRLC